MASFNAINYSLRPSKSVQRHLVFDGLNRLSTVLPIRTSKYLGFGSVWFTDFLMAHKILGIEEMTSIEGDPIGYCRAVFNKPYSTIDVINGMSGDVLVKAVNPLDITPIIAWLDYDYALDETVVNDIRFFIENAPPNSALVVTINGIESKYGNAQGRPQRLKELLGDVVPDDLSKDSCKDDQLLTTLVTYVSDYMVSIAIESARPGGAVPAFKIPYQDGAAMVTIGCILPSSANLVNATDVIRGTAWPGFPEATIRLPHLTSREVSALQATQPTRRDLSRTDVQDLGFDLEQTQIDAYKKYYVHYPMYAQVFT
ncbi:O-methyltransferase [Luteibacter sp. RCC_6_2]|uniref:O-methyltransferase n=1 Tax=Luteibacter sp. RCC_6_2 TaxID=3239223 RepID=UPI0035233ED4